MRQSRGEQRGSIRQGGTIQRTARQCTARQRKAGQGRQATYGKAGQLKAR